MVVVTGGGTIDSKVGVEREVPEDEDIVEDQEEPLDEVLEDLLGRHLCLFQNYAGPIFNGLFCCLSEQYVVIRLILLDMH